MGDWSIFSLLVLSMQSTRVLGNYILLYLYEHVSAKAGVPLRQYYNFFPIDLI